MSRPLEDKVAAITGSSRGIGKAIALELASQGANIAVCARSELSTEELPGSIGETAGEIRAMGQRALAIKTDVASEEDLRNMIRLVIEEFGRIDVLVNNVSTGSGGAFLDGNVDDLDSAYRTNVRGPYLLSLLAARQMAETGGGTIINITSGAARHPPPPNSPTPAGFTGSAILGLTKAALERLGTGIAAELMTRNIAVITVNPGATITWRTERRPGQDLSRAVPQEITAKAVAFLCRDSMPYTGQILQSREVVAQNGL